MECVSWKMSLICQVTVYRLSYSSVKPNIYLAIKNKKNSYYSLLGLAWKSAQRYLFPTVFYAFELYCSFQACRTLSWAKLMIHVVKNQIKCILLNERPRDISLVPITWQVICHVLPKREWRVSLFHTKKTTPLFKQHMTKVINQQNFHKVPLIGSAFLTNAFLLQLNNNHFLRAARWNAHLIVFQIFHISI